MSREPKKVSIFNWKRRFKYLSIAMSGIELSLFLKLRTRLIAYLIICCGVFTSGCLSASDQSIYQSHSQQIYFNNLDAEKYTINPTIYAIEQDSQGYIWFGTQHGLSRFDGVNMRHYTMVPGDKNSIVSNWIYDIHSDKEGRLWIASRNGINLYIPENDGFRVYKKGVQYPGINGTDYRAIAESSKGIMWFGSQENGLTRYDVHKNKFTSFQFDKQNVNSLSHNTINDLLIDKNDTLWVATDGGGLNIKFNSSDKFQRFSTTSELSIPSNNIRTLYEDKQGLIWIGTVDSGLFIFDIQTGVSKHFLHDSNEDSGICSNFIKDIYQDNQGRIWLATFDGLCELHIESQTFTLHTQDTGHVSSLTDSRVMSLFQDRGGVMWVGTRSGVNSWNPDVKNFTLISQRFGLGQSMSSDVITAFAQDSQENVYIATASAGVNQISPTTRQILKIQADNAPRGLKDNRVMSLLVDSKDNLWIGTVNTGLYKRHISEIDFENFQTKAADNTSISSNAISKIIELTDGTIAVATYGGGLNLLQNDSTFVRLKHDKNDPSSIASNHLIDIIEGDNGNIWIATVGGGLNRYLPKQGRIEHFKLDKSNANSLPSNDLSSILNTPEYLWIATQGSGLARLDKQQLIKGNAVFTQVNINDGLPSNVVYGLLGDDDGNIWLSHSRGISTVSQENLSIRNFNTSHGLQSRDFNSGAYFKSPNGRMFFGGANGFNTFLPNEVAFNTYEAPIRLIEFSKFNQAIPLHKAFNNNGILELSYSDSVFGFEFAALDYTKPSDNLYQYKMEGMHDKWVTTNGNNRISFFNLSDGQYKFRVKGANNDAHWSSHELMIEINILPPAWRTWWAYTIYILALFLLILTFIKVQRKKVIIERRLNTQLEKKVNERTLSLQQANLRLEEISLTDQLTGLKNRRFLLNNLKEDVGLVLRKYHEKRLHGSKEVIRQSDLIFFLIDLDHFKQVNDVHGHTAGDAVLVQIKSILEHVFRETDYLVRWGGEEFLVVARFSDREKAPELAERLRQSVEVHDFDIGQGIILKKTCSIGFASFPFIIDKPEYLSWERVVDIADHCLYSAKKSARNAWVGLDNLDCGEDGSIETITLETKSLLGSNRLKVTTSLSDVEGIKWN